MNAESLMNLSQLIAQYGYLAVFLGTLLEGETVVALGGLAAHVGHLQLAVVILVAFCGSVIGDQVSFIIGRRWGSSLLARKPRLAAAVARVRPHLVRHADVFVVINRFLIGLKTAGPIAVGTIGMSWPRFAALNMLGAALWSTAVATAGYVLGHGLQALLGDLKHAEKWIFAGILFAATAFWVVRRRRATAGGTRAS